MRKRQAENISRHFSIPVSYHLHLFSRAAFSNFRSSTLKLFSAINSAK